MSRSRRLSIAPEHMLIDGNGYQISFEIDATASAEEIGISALAEVIAWSVVEGSPFIWLSLVVVLGQGELEYMITNFRWDSCEKWAG